MSIKVESAYHNKPYNKIIAVKSITAISGLGIIDIINEIDDKVVWTYLSNNSCGKIHKSTVKYDERAYFTFKGDKHYLDEFIRV